MRFKEFKPRLFEQAAGYYTIGDSHAVAVATAGGKDWVNLAIGGKSSTDPGMLANIAKVPKGAVVLVSQGANDTANAARAHIDSQGKTPLKPAKDIAANVANVVNKVKAQGATVIFLLFPNGPGRGSGLAKYYGGDYQEEVRDAIRAAIGDVPVIDINGKPLTDGVHAGMATYKEVAGQVVGMAKPKQQPGKADAGKPDLNKIAGFDRTGKPIIAPKDGEAGQAQASAEPFSVAEPQGNRGTEVRDVQQALIALGYPLPKFGADGIRGPETSGAIKKFQADNNLEPSGVPGKTTVDKLNAKLQAKPDVLAGLKKSTTADIKPDYSKGAADLDKLADVPNAEEAKVSAEKFLGKPIDDKEWNYLLRATAAEASNDTKEQAYVMGVILNRVRSGKWGDNVISVLRAPNQFQAVTGTAADGHSPSANFVRGPTTRQLDSILKGAVDVLPSVPTNLMNFTAANLAAYGPGTNPRFRDQLLAKGGQQIGQTIFGTV